MSNSNNISYNYKKNSNRNQLFRYIIEKGKTSHREISISLNMSMPTVLSYTRGLLEMDLIAKEGLFESTGGRKAWVLVPNARAKMAIGVDITANHISLVLVDMLGHTYHVERFMSPYRKEESYYSSLGDLIQRYIKQHKIKTKKLIGIGISIPGIIDDEGTTITDSHALGIQNVDCLDFSRHIPYPCVFMNDANAACLAEMSTLKSEKIIVYLSLSNSVGGGITWKNSLYYGDNQRSGEFGHMCLVPGGKQCYCGKKGCVDAYCSALYLAAFAQGSLEQFFTNVDQGDTESITALDRYLDNLAIAVNNIRMAFDCQVIIGGYVGGFLEKHINLLRTKANLINTFDDDGTYIVPCTFRYEASAVGVAMYYIKNFIDSI